VLDLKLSLQLTPVLSFLVGPGAHRYVDVAHSNRSDHSHWYDFHIHPARLRHQGFGTKAGTYGVEIFVVAENAKAVQRYVTWSWDETFPGLQIIANAEVRKAIPVFSRK
jgi:hypothetical protein